MKNCRLLFIAGGRCLDSNAQNRYRVITLLMESSSSIGNKNPCPHVSIAQRTCDSLERHFCPLLELNKNVTTC